MANQEDTLPSLDFDLNPSSPSKRPEQFVILLEMALGQEFPEALEIINIWNAPGNPLVSVRNIEKFDEPTAKDVAHRSRGVFNDFMTSPWY